MKPSSSPSETKALLRREAKARREALPADAREAAARAIAARPFPLPIAPGVIVSGYMPFGSEIDPRPLLRVLTDQGVRLALPTVYGRGRPLVMRAWTWGEPLTGGVWAIGEPAAAADEIEPDLLIVPLLAFERSGHRLGYGAGYYDSTILRLRARKSVTAVGIAYAAQEIPAIPATPSDARLDIVLTEREVIDLRGR